MNDTLMPVGMLSRDARAAAPVLQGVQANGRLDGLLFDLRVRQTYRNTGAQTLEVVYTFPVPSGAVLLGLFVELDGQRLTGVVTARHEAERRYEKAMSDGDAPLMLERVADGLYSLSLGNLKPGQDAVIEYRYGQLLAFEQGHIRLCIPTTIAPRYGDPVLQGRLQAHQVPQATLGIEYPLQLTLDVNGQLARGEIGCATHACTFRPNGTGVRIELGQRAWLDRDVVVTLAAVGLPSLGECVGDGTGQVVLVSFQPAADAALRAQVDLKLLVDCSGSMSGDSIDSAREALRHVARQLRDVDRFSFSRFGSTTWHGMRRMAPARAANLNMLLAMIDTTDASLGGTEMAAALGETFALRGTGAAADVLLVTDGEVWDAQSLIEQARSSGHRIFAVGVGAAPAESVLRQLAEASGGACEFATPGENLRATIERMFGRIRQQPCRTPRLEWEGQASALLWTSPLPGTMFSGDTLHVFAGFAGTAPVRVRLLGNANAQAEHELASARIEVGQPAESSLPRMAAAARIATCPKEDAIALALRYQLVTEHTNCIVIKQHADADRALDFAELHQVPHMLAAGWGGTGSLRHSVGLADDRSFLCKMPFERLDQLGGFDALHVDAFAVGESTKLFQSALDDHFLTTPPQDAGRSQVEPIEIARQALRSLCEAGAAPLDEVLDQLDLPDAVRQCVAMLVKTGLSRLTAWAMLVRWLLERTEVEIAPEAELALDALVAAASEQEWQAAARIFEDALSL